MSLTKGRISLFLLTLSFLVSIGCASAPGEQEKSESEEGFPIYETDFSEDEGAFHFHRGTDISEGELHFREDNAGTNLHFPYGRNSVTEFELMIGSPDTHFIVNMLWNHEEKTSIAYHLIGEGEAQVFTVLEGEQIGEDYRMIEMPVEEWIDVRIELYQEQAELFINNEMALSTPIDPEMPESGYFFPSLGRGDAVIDNLQIRAFDAPGLRPVEGERIYETSFDDREAVKEMFSFHRGMAVENGTLRFIENDPGCNFNIPYGRNSVTDFMFKRLDEDVFFQLHLLWNHEEDNKLAYFIEKTGFELMMVSRGEELLVQNKPLFIGTDRWYKARVELIDGVSRFYLQGQLMKEAPIPPKMPEEGFFFPLVIGGQLEIDNFSITLLPEEGKEAAASSREEEPRDQPQDEQQTASGAEADEIETKSLDSSRLKERRIAVVGIQAGDENLSAALASFVTNALVNKGVGRIVERSDVEQIINEHNFQLSSVTDESTAVEIGKLLGADVIAVGSLYQVGSIDYLNLKLIEVKTGEIIASSMSTSTDEEEYLRMSNNAVEQIAR